jgi:predicted nucleic acid-binding Zn ribbon protein
VEYEGFMPICLTCGEEISEGIQYCPICGSPTKIAMPTEADQRRETFNPAKKVRKSRKTIWFFIGFLMIVGLLILVLVLSRIISTQLSQISSGLY